MVEAFGSIEKDAADREGRGDRDRSETRCATSSRCSRSSSAATGCETLHDAQQIKEEAQQMFDLGLLELESKAKIETRLLADGARRSSNLHAG